jgi:hypothetical protein
MLSGKHVREEPMPLPPGFIRWCKEEIGKIREQLDVLERAKRTPGISRDDIAASEAARLKKHIEDLQTGLSRQRADSQCQ